MIAERENLPTDEAFVRIRRYARDHNLRLSDLAGDIVKEQFDLTPARRTP